MIVHSGHEIAVSEHHALGLASGAAGVDEVHQVGVDALAAALVHGGLVAQQRAVAQFQELLPSEHASIWLDGHCGVKHHHIAQRGALGKQVARYLILALVAHHEDGGAGIVDDIGGLVLAAGGIDGHRDGTVAKGAKVGNKYFGAVLRENAHAALHFHA